jgi:hypothetical protein
MCRADGQAVLQLCFCAFGAFFRASAQTAPPMVVVAGAPYSGEQVTQRVETLRDGSRVTRSLGSAKIYRDSAGRTRTERPGIIEIEDPVAGLRYRLDSRTMTARRWKVAPEQILSGDQASSVVAVSIGNDITFSPPAGGASGSVTLTITPTGNPGAPQPHLATEDLGTLKMEGVLVEGTRQILTIPSPPGNDPPLTTVTDTWAAPDLKIVMLSKVSDPRTGETTVAMTHLSRSEPAPSLFQPGPDYKIVDGNEP